MEEKLKQIIEKHENNLIKYTKERDSIHEKMLFMLRHQCEHELAHLRTQKECVSDMFDDYQQVIEDLRELLNDWNS